jgi:hypothetical protein
MKPTFLLHRILVLQICYNYYCYCIIIFTFEKNLLLKYLIYIKFGRCNLKVSHCHVCVVLMFVTYLNAKFYVPSPTHGIHVVRYFTFCKKKLPQWKLHSFWKSVSKNPKHVKAYANNKCNLITLGGVNEVVLIVTLIRYYRVLTMVYNTQRYWSEILGPVIEVSSF